MTQSKTKKIMTSGKDKAKRKFKVRSYRSCFFLIYRKNDNVMKTNSDTVTDSVTKEKLQVAIRSGNE